MKLRELLSIFNDGVIVTLVFFENGLLLKGRAITRDIKEKSHAFLERDVLNLYVMDGDICIELKSEHDSERKW